MQLDVKTSTHGGRQESFPPQMATQITGLADV